jgi:ribosomal protein S1
MAKSKNKRKNGTKVSGKAVKLTKKDNLRRRNAYFDKQEEYSKLSDQELLDLHNTGTVKGGYLVALETVIAFKAKASMNK